MMGKISFIAFLLALAALPARAEPIPDYVLNKDYENCVGTEASDKDKVAYCQCVRDTMKKSWSLDDYGALAEEAIKNPKEPPARLQALAQACAEKVLK